MKPEFIVAVKEFKDYLSSKRFMLIFGVLALLTIIGAITGLVTYNNSLDTYNSNIATINSTAGFAGQIRQMVEMPSLLSVFESYGTYIASLGAFLAICMGFDMISREKEEGTLKLLLTHPVFRDSVINGKITGAAIMLVIVLSSTFLATIAIMMFFGVVPGTEDLIRIGAFFGMTLLFMFTWLAISITASTVSSNSSMAILITIFLLLFAVVIPDISSTLGSAIMGSAPEMMIPSTSTNTSGSSSSSTSTSVTIVTSTFAEGPPDASGPGFSRNGTRMTINPEYTSYWSTRNQLESIMNILSPGYNYEVISQVITEELSSPRTTGSGNMGFFERSSDDSVSIWESLSSVWMNISAMIVMIIAGFGIAYVRFIRVDVR